MGRNEVGVNLDDVPTASPLMDLPEVLRARLTSRFLPRLSVLAAFGIALFFVAAGMAVRLLFAEELGQRATFIFFVPGVVVAGDPSGPGAGTRLALAPAPPGRPVHNTLGKHLVRVRWPCNSRVRVVGYS